ncbi:MAG: hypothetical protein RLO50_05140 [Azospirillaceae bacterium]
MTKRNRFAATAIAAVSTFAIGAAVTIGSLGAIATDAVAQPGPVTYVPDFPDIPDRPRTEVHEGFERDICGVLAIQHLGYSQQYGHVFEMTNSSNATASVYAVANSSVRQQFWVPNGAVMTVALGQGQLIETLEFASDRCETDVDLARGQIAPFSGPISIPPLFM